VLNTGMPKPLELALFIREYEREVRTPFPPPSAVRVATAPLAALARRLGRGERCRRTAAAGVPALATA